MTWFKIDDSFYDHPKVFDAPDCAVALWVRAGTWSARNLTDGFVPTGMPARLCDDPDTAIRELIRRGLWSRAKDGFRFHDWTDYQPTREAKERERDAAAERKRRQRERVKQQVATPSVTDASRRDMGVSHTGSPGGSHTSPTRPDPTRPSPIGEGPQKASPSSVTADAAFDEFWSTYPRREAKGAARKAWDKAIKRAEPAEILAGAGRYRDQPGRDPRYTAHPATWLNADRWSDEAAPAGGHTNGYESFRNPEDVEAAYGGIL